ncbi:MAG: hypothetical protein KKD69_05865, partial [Euryarchaeota archaeon]|nr:hypothetical protein [Euryarchaeota archaeon]
FKNEEDFLKNAIKEMVRKYEVQELNIRMDEFARKMAKKHPKSLSEMVYSSCIYYFECEGGDLNP